MDISGGGGACKFTKSTMIVFYYYFSLSKFKTMSDLGSDGELDKNDSATEQETFGGQVDNDAPDNWTNEQDNSDGLQDEYLPPISARPPKVVAQEESQVEVSASPAFQCLDEVR